MLALLQNEMVLYAIIILLVGSFLIAKTVGFKKFVGFFRGSGKRVAEAKAKNAAAKAAKSDEAKATD